MVHLLGTGDREDEEDDGDDNDNDNDNDDDDEEEEEEEEVEEDQDKFNFGHFSESDGEWYSGNYHLEAHVHEWLKRGSSEQTILACHLPKPLNELVNELSIISVFTKPWIVPHLNIYFCAASFIFRGVGLLKNEKGQSQKYHIRKDTNKITPK